MPLSPAYRASTSHAALGPEFYDVVAAAVFPDHILRYRNQRVAKTVGLDTLSDEEWIAHFGRFVPLSANFEQPLALRYHGHQFRVYNPELGDGRGFLFAQLYDDKGRLLDLATKGSGKTPWSRTADGRLTLKGGVREVLATSMLEALGVDTSKTFSLVETGEALERGDEPSPTRSSVMVRLSHSHIRIGTFQRLAFHRSTENIVKLLDYTIKTYMPDVWRDDVPARAVAFLEEVCRRVARVGAQWMAAGFVHGVLNTDNINVTGESFDYGPWRFLPMLDPAFTAAYFDETGLYAYGRQPDALFWNVTRLAECLLGIADQPSLEKALGVFEPTIRQEFTSAMVKRLGVQSLDAVRDNELVRALWIFLSETKAPFEQTFFDWFGGIASAERAARSPSKDFYANPAFSAVHDALKDFVPRDGVDLNHAYFSKPAACTMLIEEVEAIWKPIADSDDWSVFHTKLQAIDEMREAYGLA
ncbi:MAG: YdiU family protein [Afipia birgiae]|nr:YdiU family protein [Afipia birgiae]